MVVLHDGTTATQEEPITIGRFGLADFKAQKRMIILSYEQLPINYGGKILNGSSARIWRFPPRGTSMTINNDVHAGAVTITINRPAVRNAIDLATHEMMSALWPDLEKDAPPGRSRRRRKSNIHARRIRNPARVMVGRGVGEAAATA